MGGKGRGHSGLRRWWLTGGTVVFLAVKSRLHSEGNVMLHWNFNDLKF